MRTNMVRSYDTPKYKRICKICGKEFLAKHPKTEFCDECKEKRNKQGRQGTDTKKFKYSDRKCERCGAVYTPTSSRQKYCVECRSTVNKERDKSYVVHKSESEYISVCPCCGEEFTKTGNNQIYCLRCSSLENYRRIAFVNLPRVCCKCGKSVGLDNSNVHHKDHIHFNNDLQNLEIRCVKCHRIEHAIRDSKTGKIITNI